MKILVIGGTQFLGRHVVGTLLAAGHEVVLLNRGITNPHLFPELRRIKMDRRSSDLQSRLQGGSDHYDAVIDLCAYFPEYVSKTIAALRGRAKRYILRSTGSVYRAIGEYMNAVAAGQKPNPLPLLRETDPMVTCSAEQSIDPSNSTFGARKAECERIALSARGPDLEVIVLRPNIVFGQWDPTDRFAYWVDRVVSEDPFILPDDGINTVQLTYAPDLAEAFRRAAEVDSLPGRIYNIVQTESLSLAGLVDSLARYFHQDAAERAGSVSVDEIKAAGIKLGGIPLWIPGTDLRFDMQRAKSDLKWRETPIKDAIATAAARFLAEKRDTKAGLTREKEKAILGSRDWS